MIYRVRAELPSRMAVTIWTGTGKTIAQRVIWIDNDEDVLRISE